MSNVSDFLVTLELDTKIFDIRFVPFQSPNILKSFAPDIRFSRFIFLPWPKYAGITVLYRVVPTALYFFCLFFFHFFYFLFATPTVITYHKRIVSVERKKNAPEKNAMAKSLRFKIIWSLIFMKLFQKYHLRLYKIPDLPKKGVISLFFLYSVFQLQAQIQACSMLPLHLTAPIYSYFGGSRRYGSAKMSEEARRWEKRLKKLRKMIPVTTSTEHPNNGDVFKN